MRWIRRRPRHSPPPFGKLPGLPGRDELGSGRWPSKSSPSNRSTGQAVRSGQAGPEQRPAPATTPLLRSAWLPAEPCSFHRARPVFRLSLRIPTESITSFFRPSGRAPRLRNRARTYRKDRCLSSLAPRPIILRTPPVSFSAASVKIHRIACGCFQSEKPYADRVSTDVRLRTKTVPRSNSRDSPRRCFP